MVFGSLQLGVGVGLFGFGFGVDFDAGVGLGFGSDFWFGIMFSTAYGRCFGGGLEWFCVRLYVNGSGTFWKIMGN